MSSVSSHDGSDKDSIRHKPLTADDLPSRYSALRKTDLLDAMDSFNRTRDIDSWSVAATIDDQESVISAQGNASASGSGGGSGGLVGLSTSSTTILDTALTPSHDDTCFSSLDNTGTPTGDPTLVCGTAINNTVSGTTVGSSNSSNMAIGNNNSERHLHGDGGGSLLGVPMETLRDLDNNDQHSTSDDEDRRSRSNAAEFGDDGTRSAGADFDVDSESGSNDDNNDDDDDTSRRGNEQQQRQQHITTMRGQDDTHQHQHQAKHEQNAHHHHHPYSRRRHQHNVVNDSIAAPPQPQPSFAPVTKSYVELLEENDVLQSQIHNLRITQKHQAQVIDNLRSLTECGEKVFDKAIHLSQLTSDEQQHLIKVSQVQPLGQTAPTAYQPILSPEQQQPTHENMSLALESPPQQLQLQQLSMMEQNEQQQLQTTAVTPPVMHEHTMTELLERLYERIHQFVATTVDMPWQLSLEQALFSTITDAYLAALPFGTSQHILLNIAYRDQLRRFQSTLGSSFAKWYRRQTVQSLSLNPATKEYLEHMQEQVTLQLMTLLTEQGMQKTNNKQQTYTTTAASAWVDQTAWMDVLHWCRILSLEIHGDEADVVVQPISTGIDFDAGIMTAVVADDTSAKYVITNNNNKEETSTIATPPPPPTTATTTTTTTTRKVKYVLSPLFIDEDDQVLLTARVLLDD